MIEKNSIHHYREVPSVHSSSETCQHCHEMELYDILTAALILLLFTAMYRAKKLLKK